MVLSGRGIDQQAEWINRFDVVYIRAHGPVGKAQDAGKPAGEENVAAINGGQAMSLRDWLGGKPQTSKNVALVQGSPVRTGTTINIVPRVAAIEPKAGGPAIDEDRDHFVLGQRLIDTLVPHAMPIQSTVRRRVASVPGMRLLPPLLSCVAICEPHARGCSLWRAGRTSVEWLKTCRRGFSPS